MNKKNQKTKRKFSESRCLRSFTIIELLLGMSIFSLIMLCVYGAFYSGVKMSHRSGKQQKIYREARFSFDLISRELENMAPFHYLEDGEQQIVFVGDHDQITFVYPTEKGLKAVSYFLETPEKSSIHKVIIGKRYKKNVKVVSKYTQESSQIDFLMRQEKDFSEYFSDGSKESMLEEIIATKTVENGLRFFYGYLQSEESQEIVWDEKWTESEIPMYVRLEMDFLLEDENVLTLSRNVLIPTGSVVVKQ